MKFSLPLLMAASVAAVLPLSVKAQTLCTDHDSIVERLTTTYGESRQSIALGSNNTIVETFASLDTGTWTIVVTTPGGPSCLVAAGQAYQPIAQVAAPLDEEA